MSAQPFQPLAADGRSRGRMLVDHLKERRPNDVLTYREIAVIAGDPALPNSVVQTVVAQAQPLLRRECLRNLVNVKGVGYRLSMSKEHSDLATRQHVKARKRIAVGIETLRCTNVSELTEQERVRIEAQQMINVGLAAQMDHMQDRQDQQERALRSLTEDVRRLKQKAASGYVPLP